MPDESYDLMKKRQCIKTTNDVEYMLSKNIRNKRKQLTNDTMRFEKNEKLQNADVVGMHKEEHNCNSEIVLLDWIESKNRRVIMKIENVCHGINT